MKKPSSPEKTAFSLLFGVYKPVEVFFELCSQVIGQV